MRALVSFLYGLVAYLACMATLLYLVGFGGNLLVPHSVDAGGAPAAGLGEAVLADILLLALFGVQHSVMARRSFKTAWTRLVPAVLERSTFVLATCVVLALLFWFWTPITVPVVWRVEGRTAAGLLWCVYAVGWLVALVSTFLLDHFELFGLRQALGARLPRAASGGGFKTPLFYRHVRHPLYLGLLLTFWSVPVMTFGHLLFSAGLSAYVLMGIAFEERDLVVQFGERYLAYRREVGMLLPRARLSRPGPEGR